MKLKTDFKKLKDGWGIAKMPGGIHDTFKVNKDGDITGYHTTVQIPGGKKIHIPLDSKK